MIWWNQCQSISLQWSNSCSSCATLPCRGPRCDNLAVSPKSTGLMWVKQCHKPFPSHHHFYRWHSMITIPSHGWFMALFYPHYSTNIPYSYSHYSWSYLPIPLIFHYWWEYYTNYYYHYIATIIIYQLILLQSSYSYYNYYITITTIIAIIIYIYYYITITILL